MIRGPIKPEFYYMQKVLPLVYDESLSYYEAVQKLVYKINEIGTCTNKLIQHDVGFFIRKQLNKIFNESFYVEENESLVLVLSPAENIFVSDIYVAQEEKLALTIRYCGEVCNG